MNRTAALVAGLTGALLASSAAADNWTPVSTASSSALVEEDTRLKDMDPILSQLFMPDQDLDMSLRSILRLFPVEPGLFGVKKVKKGRAKVTTNCFSPGSIRSLGSKTVKSDANGNFVYTREIAASLDCDFFQVQWDLLKKVLIPAGTSVEVNTAVELIGSDADPDCSDSTSLCLNDDRFLVQIDWRSFPGPGATDSGSAVGLPRTDDSGVFYFFNPDNWEMLVKVLDGCAINDHFWVFHAATTNVEYTLTVTDTVVGTTEVYGNGLGTPAPTILDTEAFATCP